MCRVCGLWRYHWSVYSVCVCVYVCVCVVVVVLLVRLCVCLLLMCLSDIGVGVCLCSCGVGAGGSGGLCEFAYQLTKTTLDWKRFIDNIASVWEATTNEVEDFINEANRFHFIKFTAEISDTQATFLDTTHSKESISNKKAILDIKTHFSTSISDQATRQMLKQALSKAKALYY